MKTNLTYLVIGLVALNTACTDKDNLDLTNENTAPLSINAVAPGNDTRVTFTDNTATDASSYNMKVEWAAGDNMLLANADASKSCTLTTTETGHSATFSTPTSAYTPAAGEQVYGYFPSTLKANTLTDYSPDGSTGVATTNNYFVDYSAAGGTDPSTIANTAVMNATNQYSDNVPLNFNNATSIIRLKLTFPSQAEANKINKVELYSAKGEFVTSADMQVAADGTTTWRAPKSGADAITVPENSGAEDGTLTLYTLAIPQENVPDMCILATTADKSEAYFAKLSSTPTFKASGMCGIVKTMAKASVTTVDATEFDAAEDVWVVYGSSMDNSFTKQTDGTWVYTSNNIVVTKLQEMRTNKSTRKITLIMPELTTIKTNDPFGQSELKAAKTGVTSYNLPNLEYVYMPIITALHDNTFRYCNNLLGVCIPKVKTAGQFAFFNCLSLTSVNLPSLTALQSGVLKSNPALTKVTLGNITGYSLYNGTAIVDNSAKNAYANVDLYINLGTKKISSTGTKNVAATATAPGYTQTTTTDYIFDSNTAKFTTRVTVVKSKYTDGSADQTKVTSTDVQFKSITRQ